MNPRLLVPVLVAAVAALPAAPAAPARAAAPGVFAGTLGVPVPRGAVAEVRAIDRRSGRVVTGRTVGRTGAFRLSLPPGSYFVAGAVLRRGAARPATIGIGLSLKPGQRRLRTNLRAKRVKRPVRRPRAREMYRQERGQVTPGSVAVQIPYFTGASGEYGFMNRGLADLLTTDVVNNDCGVTVREVNRIGDVLRELEFQQSPYVDPASRVQRNFVVSDVEVRGTLRTERAPLPVGSRLAYEMRIVDLRTGETLGTVTGALDRNRFFEDADGLGGRLRDELCRLGDVYEVTLDVRGTLRAALHDATGTLRSTLRARRGAGPDGDTWKDQGTLVWGDLAFTPKTECPLVDPVPGASPWSVTITDAGGGELRVTWSTEDVGPAQNSTATIDCPPDDSDPPNDPPPVPGMPGPSLLNTGPQTFTVPYAGGVQPLSGEVSLGSDGFFNSGTITVRPAGVAARRG